MKILYVATLSYMINSFLVPRIEKLISLGNKVDVACKIREPIDPRIKQIGCNIYDIPMNRKPLHKGNFESFRQLKSLLKENKYDIIHTHTPVASAIVRIANINRYRSKMLYTAHGFHFFKGASIKNWLIYYPIESVLSRVTDTVITINSEDFQRASTKMKAKRIVYIPGVGIDTAKIVNSKGNKEVVRNELGVPQNCFLIVSVGELNNNKNHEVVMDRLHLIGQ